MKKTFMTTVLFVCVCTISLPLQAQDHGQYHQGGYTGSSANQVITVAQAKKSVDDRYVVLRGKLIKQVGSDKYILKDTSGEIVVDIDQDKWHGLTVDANDTVEVRGEVDRDWHSIEVDVDFIQKVGA